MNQVLQKSEHITSLATSCIKFSVECRVWSATKQDRDVSNEVNDSKKASKNSGRFITHLLAGNVEHRDIMNYKHTVYNWERRIGYDWSAGESILHYAELPKLMREFKDHDTKFTDLVEKFLAKYPSIVSNMAFVQGDLFNKDDYPPVDKLRSKFGLDLYTSEVPLSDFRCQLSQDLADELYNNYARQAERIVNNVLVKQSEQLMTVMSSLSHCCEIDMVQDKNGEMKPKRRRLHETTVERALEMCRTFETFNLSNNQQLEDARRALASALDGHTYKTLQNSDEARAEIKTAVDDILSKFKPVNLD